VSQWVFLRGLSRDSRHWGDFPDTFRQALPDATVLAIDLPGNGSLHAMDSPSTVEQMAEFCRAQLAQRGLAPPYRLLAMSLGAMVAVDWASRQPEEIDACVLINTSLRPFSPFHFRLRPQNYPALLKLALFGGDLAREASILRLTSHLVRSPGTVLERWTSFRQACPVTRRNMFRQLLAAARYRAPLARPLTRVLVLSCACDTLVDARCSQQLAARWQAELAEHPAAGHDLPLDDGPWVAQQIKEWLEEGCAPQEEGR